MADAFVDTSFVVALVNKNDQYHNQAIEFASHFDKRPLVTTDAILLEVGNALARKFTFSDDCRAHTYDARAIG